MLTFDDEVRYIWPQRFSLTKGLFFFIQYFTAIVLISLQFVEISTRDPRRPLQTCYIWSVWEALAAFLIIISVDYILVARIYALYPHNRIVKYLIGLFYAAEIIAIAIGFGMAVPQVEFDELCTIVKSPRIFLVAIGAPVAFQTILFAVTMWKFISVVRVGGWKYAHLTMVLVRDGTWAFILLFLLLISEAFLYGFASKAYTGVMYGWLNTLFAFCGYRIILNLKKAGHAQALPPDSYILDGEATISFATAGHGTSRDWDPYYQLQPCRNPPK
ncbi:hypothetical protein CC2G_006494 [Coprinopsis cinerea AmutBmut pab1-1]|nr:hypothetical protein CC2G_006494 [Coprinopsis cinerea AmutBmut pab1-1]